MIRALNAARDACAASVIVPVIVLLGACGLSTVPIDGGKGVAVPGVPDLPCGQTTEFAFVGETSLAAIGLDDFGPDSQRVGMVWVTAGPVGMDGPPMPAGAVELENARMVCVQFPDGSGMVTNIDDAWQPPAGSAAASQPADAQPPFALLGLIGAAVLVIGVSFIAFRSERTG